MLSVVLHAHSDWSYDGRWSLGALARLFGGLGVDVLMMSEHDDGFSQERFDAYRAACVAASTARCLLVPGIEYSSPDNDIHILTWGLTRFLGEHRPVEATLAEVHAEGGTAVLAHPHRRDVWRRFDPAWVPFLSGVEIWNRKTDGIAPGPEAVALADRTGLPGLVGVDFHRVNQTYPLDHAVQDGPDRAAAAVEAVRAGRATARAFGRPLRQPDGAWHGEALARHARFERLRLNLRNTLRPRRG